MSSRPPSHSGVRAFRSSADEYDAWFERPLARYVERQELEALRVCLSHRDLTGSHWLEVGAGTGRVAGRLASWGAHVVAVEPCRRMRERGRRQSDQSDVEWVDAWAESLPWAAPRFDGVLFFASLEFVSDPQAAIGEALRVLAPSGSLVVGHFAPGGAWTERYRRKAAEGKVPWTEARWFSSTELLRMVPRALRCSYRCLYLSPAAEPPFEREDETSRRHGNPPSWEVLRWDNQSRLS